MRHIFFPCFIINWRVPQLWIASERSYRKSPHSTVKVEHQKTVLWEIRTMRIKYRNIAQNSTIEKFILVLWEEWIFFKNRTIEKSVLWEDALWGDSLYWQGLTLSPHEPQLAYIFQGSESIVEPQQLSKTNFLAANMYFESA